MSPHRRIKWCVEFSGSSSACDKGSQGLRERSQPVTPNVEHHAHQHAEFAYVSTARIRVQTVTRAHGSAETLFLSPFGGARGVDVAVSLLALGEDGHALADGKCYGVSPAGGVCSYGWYLPPGDGGAATYIHTYIHLLLFSSHALPLICVLSI